MYLNVVHSVRLLSKTFGFMCFLEIFFVLGSNKNKDKSKSKSKSKSERAITNTWKKDM